MPFTIEVDDRQWDTINLSNALIIPAERQYFAELTVDEPGHGYIVFHGTVQLLWATGDILTVAPFVEAIGLADETKAWQVDLADIRRISFY